MKLVCDILFFLFCFCMVLVGPIGLFIASLGFTVDGDNQK